MYIYDNLCAFRYTVGLVAILFCLMYVLNRNKMMECFMNATYGFDCDRYTEALIPISQSMQLCRAKKGLRIAYKWPGTDRFIEHTDSNNLKV